MPESRDDDCCGGVVSSYPPAGTTQRVRTDRGRVVLQRCRTHGSCIGQTRSGVPQGRRSHSRMSACATRVMTAADLVTELVAAKGNPSLRLLCSLELARFTSSDRDVLLPLLWQYILDRRDSSDRQQLTGVAAAIRKYIAIMPMDKMSDLAALLETGHRSPVPIDLEIEIVKMIYRNFEVHPPVVADPQPHLCSSCGR